MDVNTFVAYLEGLIDENEVVEEGGEQNGRDARREERVIPGREVGKSNREDLNDDDIFGTTGQRDAQPQSVDRSSERRVETAYQSGRATRGTGGNIPSSSLNDQDIFGPGTPKRSGRRVENGAGRTVSSSRLFKGTTASSLMDEDIFGDIRSPMQRAVEARPSPRRPTTEKMRTGEIQEFVLGKRRSVAREETSSAMNSFHQKRPNSRMSEGGRWTSRDQRPPPKSSDALRVRDVTKYSLDMYEKDGMMKSTETTVTRRTGVCVDERGNSGREKKSLTAKTVGNHKNRIVAVETEKNKIEYDPQKTIHGLPRSASEICSYFPEVSWRIDYDPNDESEPPPLTELCFRMAVTHSSKFGYLGEIPDHYMYKLLQHTTPESLETIEELNPYNVAACDAAWSRICKEKYGIEHLAVEFPRWRAQHEALQREKEARLNAAARRLRESYLEQDSDRNRRKMTVMAKVPPKGIAKRKMRPLDRLREQKRTLRF